VDVRDPSTVRVRLESDEVHLWWGRMDAGEDLEAVLGWLSDEERRRAERFRRARDARGFLFRRAFLRVVLARYAAVGPGELSFVRGGFGKPFLAGPHARLRFSASSSGALALVGVSLGRELGVDVEQAGGRLLDTEEVSRLAQRVLTHGERECLARLAAGERAHAFLRAWTRKEALLKALGTGLSREPDTVEVGLEPHAGERELDARLFAGRLLDLHAPPGFVASAAVTAVPHERLRWELRAGPNRALPRS
jgi:4'-phosphopantetheinyl transferase